MCLNKDGERRFRLMRWGLLPPSSRIPNLAAPDQCARRGHLDQFRLPARFRRAALPRAGGRVLRMDRSQGRTPALSAPPAQGRPNCACRIGSSGGQRGRRDRHGRHHHLRCRCYGAPLHDRMGGARARALRSLARLQGNEGESGARTIKPPPDDLFEAIEMHPKLNDSRRDDLGIQEPLQTQLLLLATSRPTAACRD